MHDDLKVSLPGRTEDIPLFCRTRARTRVNTFMPVSENAAADFLSTTIGEFSVSKRSVWTGTRSCLGRFRGRGAEEV